MNEVIITIVTTLGTIAAGFFTLVKMGLIQIGKTNGNGIASRMTALEEHFNHETTNALNRIEQAVREGFRDIGEKLEDMKTDIIIIKTKQNGK